MATVSCTIVLLSHRVHAALSVAEDERVLVDTTRSTPPDGAYPGSPERTLRTRLWYPTGTCGVGDSCAPYPLVLLAHGFGGRPESYDAFARTVAAAGYVVAAPAFPLTNGDGPSGGNGLVDAVNQPADLVFVAAEVVAASAQGSDSLFGLVDPAATAVIGHSLGGATALTLAHSNCCTSLPLAAAVLVAAAPDLGGSAIVDTGPETLVVHGTEDATIPFALARATFERLPWPRFFVGLVGTGHGEMLTSQIEPPIPARARAELGIVSFLDARMRGDAAGFDAALAGLRADLQIVVADRCDVATEVCEPACTTIAWTDPPLHPPDQNPAGATVRLAGLAGGAGAARIVASGSVNPASGAPAVDPDAAGVHLRLSIDGDAAFDANLPGDDLGFAPCAAGDGWQQARRPAGTVWIYRNRSGAVPPLCTPASAAGVRAVVVADRTTTKTRAYRYKVKAKKTALLHAVGEPLTALRFELAFGAEIERGIPPAQAEAGACAAQRIAGAPISQVAPRPFCRRVGKAGTLTGLTCKGS